MPRVLNARTVGTTVEGAVYVGRPSKWGNPYKIGPRCTRLQAIALFENYLVNSGLLKDIAQLRGKDLICWCAPEACHADILLKLANEERNYVLERVDPSYLRNSEDRSSSRGPGVVGSYAPPLWHRDV